MGWDSLDWNSSRVGAVMTSTGRLVGLALVV